MKPTTRDGAVRWKRPSAMILACTLAALAAMPAAVAAKREPELRAVSTLSTAKRAQLEALLESVIMEELRDVGLQEGQQRPNSVSVRYDPKTSFVHVDFGLEFLPANRDTKVAVDEQLQSVNNAIITTVGLEFVLSGSVITFGGIPTSDHFMDAVGRL